MTKDEELELEELVRAVASIGVSGGDRKKFVGAMLREHRTLQQSFTKLVVDWLVALSESNYDMRNEASVKLAQALVPVIEDMPGLPYI
jgi:hypothetical protein